MTLKIAINGFGRIGRLALRSIMETGREGVEVVAINDLGPVETNAHLVQYDSVHGRFPNEVKSTADTIDVGAGPIKVFAERDPSKLPWGDLGVDIVYECTGIFATRDKAAMHLDAGAKRVWSPHLLPALIRRSFLASITTVSPQLIRLCLMRLARQIASPRL